jgi:CHAD domain-containing protein
MPRNWRQSFPAVFEIVTPSSLFHTQSSALERALPAVLNGQADGIHDARIATRRIRELLPLVIGESGADHDGLRTRFRRLGRSLGRVRDADVRLALLATLERRIPHAAPTLVLLRQQRERERLQLMRKLIKRLERLDVMHLAGSLARHNGTWRRVLQAGLHRRSWRRALHAVVAARGDAAVDAIAHATCVYFPNRLHRARIAIKKLRYATEIVHATGSADRSAMIKEMKRAQDTLGDLHDREDLIGHLASETSAGPLDAAQVALIRQVLDAEARHLHARYLDRRDGLLAACHDAMAATSSPVAARSSLVAIGAVAVSSTIYLARRRRAGASVRALTAVRAR